MIIYPIEIADEMIPEGMEPVAFRIPLDGESIIGTGGKIQESWAPYPEPRLILRRTWIWPAWLNADKITWCGRSWRMCFSDGNSFGISEDDWLLIFSYPPPGKTRVYENPNKVKP